jgi:hypothetical protein
MGPVGSGCRGFVGASMLRRIRKLYDSQGNRFADYMMDLVRMQFTTEVVASGELLIRFQFYLQVNLFFLE